jgi:hypothetical protein
VALGVDDADLLRRRLRVRLEQQRVLVDQHPQAAGANVMIFKNILAKKYDKKLATLTQNTAV